MAVIMIMCVRVILPCCQCRKPLNEKYFSVPRSHHAIVGIHAYKSNFLSEHKIKLCAYTMALRNDVHVHVHVNWFGSTKMNVYMREREAKAKQPPFPKTEIHLKLCVANCMMSTT